MRRIPWIEGIGDIIALAALIAIAILFHTGQTENKPNEHHSNIPCSKCHEVMAQLNYEGFSTARINSQCYSCHRIVEENMTGFRPGFHRDTKRSCLDCHSFHKSAQLTAGERQFNFDYSNSKLAALCGTCHDVDKEIANLTAGHREAAKLYHSDYQYLSYLSPSESCLLCHAAGAVIDRSVADIANPPRFNQHKGHPLGVPMVPVSGNGGYGVRNEIDSHLVLYNNRIECQTCHSLTSNKNNLIAGFSDSSELCTGCHVRDWNKQ
jgi:predicted CXXCH cytochrome family protein